MPHPARISQPHLLQAARLLLESEGPGGLTMRSLARSLRVSAPSLYFHVESRADLLSQLISIGLRELERTIAAAAAVPGPISARALRIAHSYIDFATANPQLFTLIFGPCIDEDRYDRAAGDAAAAPVLALCAEIVPEDDALNLASAVWAFVHGYTVLRLAAQFRTNPAHEPAFERALIAMIEGARVAVATPVR